MKWSDFVSNCHCVICGKERVLVGELVVFSNVSDGDNIHYDNNFNFVKLLTPKTLKIFHKDCFDKFIDGEEWYDHS